MVMAVKKTINLNFQQGWENFLERLAHLQNYKGLLGIDPYVLEFSSKNLSLKKIKIKIF